MMGTFEHNSYLTRSRPHRRALVPYVPLSVEEFLLHTQVEAAKRMQSGVLDRLWVRPVQRLLQDIFGIDQSLYSADTSPTISELKEDFESAAIITIDKFLRNPEDFSGRESVEGASFNRNSKIPERARVLLERYRRMGGRVERG